MHLEILDDTRINLLKELNNLSFINLFSMGGGTALSLQLGLRESFDFDFFSYWHFDPNILYEELKEMFKDRIELIDMETRVSTLDLYIDHIQVSFFEYNYPLLDKTITLDKLQNVNLLSINDIACMKVIAIIQRGTKKDFYDLYFIAKYENYTLNKLLSLLQNKFNDKNVITNFSYAMVYFNDADKDSLPKSFVDYDWETIKSYFKSLQLDIYKII